MSRPLVDFGKTARDYARYRPGFPAVFFDRVRRYGIGLPGQRVADLGAGTGALARGFADRGCQAVGIDPSPEMLAEAVALGRVAGVQVRYVCAWGEATGLREGAVDVACAGQCWHWFDRTRAAAEVSRVLRPGGRMLIAYFSYLADPGTLGAATERIVLRYNPAWAYAGKDGRFPEFASDLTAQGLRHVDTFEFETDVDFTHESWRGRFRACNGVLALPAAQLSAFDQDLARMLAESYPEPLTARHRAFGIVAEKPASFDRTLTGTTVTRSRWPSSRRCVPLSPAPTSAPARSTVARASGSRPKRI
jgi:SAM-dependent methyltransferase